MEFCNGLFIAERDKHCWTLKEWYLSKGKGDVMTERFRETYHGNLEQVCETIIDRRAGDCDQLPVLIELLQHANLMLTDAAKDISS